MTAETNILTGTAPSRGTGPAKHGAGWPAGRAAGMGLAGLGGLVGVVMLLAGLAVVCVHGFARDGDGYYSETDQLQSSARAITTGEMDLAGEPGEPAPAALIGDLRLSAESTDERPLFVGVGPTAEVERYLAGVSRDELSDFGGRKAEYERLPGRSRPRPPAAQDFWIASAHGPGRQEIDWNPGGEAISAVVMNADGSRGISAEAKGGARLDWLLWAGIGLAALGAAIAAGAGALVTGIWRRAEG